MTVFKHTISISVEAAGTGAPHVWKGKFQLLRFVPVASDMAVRLELDPERCGGFHFLF